MAASFQTIGIVAGGTSFVICGQLRIRYLEVVIKSDSRRRSEVDDERLRTSRDVGRNFEMVVRCFTNAAESEARAFTCVLIIQKYSVRRPDATIAEFVLPLTFPRSSL